MAFRNILCPIDFSEGARRAAELAADIVDPAGTGITLLHVIEVPVPFAGEPTAAGFLESLDRRAAQLLQEWGAALQKRSPVPVHTRSRIGSPSGQTIALLEAEPVFDLVVVGSHGRTGLRRFLLGSVAERIVRHAPCPVLVAHTREAAAAATAAGAT